jgi:hypothetical protein
VTAPKIKKSAVTNAKIGANAVTGAKVKDDSLTGGDVLESSLGTVPSATNATNATNAINATNATNATSATNATNATNAAALNGIAANGLTRVARTSSAATLALTTSAQTYGTPLSITAPAAGFVLVTGSYTIQSDGACTAGSAECFAYGVLRHIQDNATSQIAEAGFATQPRSNMALAWVFPVNAGVNTFDIRTYRQSPGTTGVVNGWYSELTAIYAPFGSTGSTTLSPSGGRTSTKQH